MQCRELREEELFDLVPAVDGPAQKSANLAQQRGGVERLSWCNAIGSEFRRLLAGTFEGR